VAVLGDVLYVMGGCANYYSRLKTAVQYDSKTDRWSPIADMNVAREGASATALKGNNIMKQEGIRTKGVVKWVHNVEVMYVCQQAKV
jgi:hypothetical protein